MKILGGISVIAAMAITAGAALAQDLTVGVSWSNFQEERWKTDEAAIKRALAAGGLHGRGLGDHRGRLHAA